MNILRDAIGKVPIYHGLIWYVSNRNSLQAVIDFHFPEVRYNESLIAFWETVEVISDNLSQTLKIDKYIEGGYCEIIDLISNKMICHIRLMILSSRMYLKPILGKGTKIHTNWIFPIRTEDWNNDLWNFPKNYQEVISSFKTLSTITIMSNCR